MLLCVELGRAGTGCQGGLGGQGDSDHSWGVLGLHLMFQGRQNPTGPNRTEHNPTKSIGPNKTQQNPTGRNKIEQNPTKPNRTQQDSTKPNRTQKNPVKSNKTQPNPMVHMDRSHEWGEGVWHLGPPAPSWPVAEELRDTKLPSSCQHLLPPKHGTGTSTL